jgi:4'-phosphopantetheinyl transferase
MPWSDPPKILNISKDEVHVWRTPVVLPDEFLKSLMDILSDDEKKRAERFRFETDRNRFIASHGALRSVLSLYLMLEPSGIKYSFNSHGKPGLNSELNRGGLKFNISHSYEMALVAVCEGREVGIDVQHIKNNFRCMEIAGRFFSANEASALSSFPEDQLKDCFFKCWARKEAFIKAKGGGLSIPLNHFDVSVGPGKPAELLNTRWDTEEAGRWSIEDIDAGKNYAAALAVEGKGVKFKFWNWKMQF